MKIILSRKGFDVQNGGQASPILCNGTLLSLPIPYNNDLYHFSDIHYDGQTYYDIISQLKPNPAIQINSTCHLDPDIRKGIATENENWKPIFGQAGSSQSLLQNCNVEIGDIFLFFGTFKETRLKENRLEYITDKRDLHVIYGYLQIGEIIQSNQDVLPDYVLHHSHAHGNLRNDNTSFMYVAKEKLSLNENLPGASVLNFKQKLVLTKAGMTKSKWSVPGFFKNLNFYWNTKNAFKEGYFQSPHKGQEFVIEANDELANWAKELIEAGSNIN